MPGIDWKKGQRTGKYRAVLQLGKGDLSKCVHHTRSLTFHISFRHNDPLFASQVQILHKISGNMMNLDQNCILLEKNEADRDRMWMDVHHENFKQAETES